MSLEKIKQLREQTGAGIVDVKKALDEAQGNEIEAIKILRKKGAEKASKKLTRTTQEGVIASYIHSNKKVGAMVKLLCETDFVALNGDFQELAKEIAMHITAMNPQCIKPEEVSLEIVEKEKVIWVEKLKNEGKTKEMIAKIIIEKEKKFREEKALLTQAFIKNPEQTIEELITQTISKIGENIQVASFNRLEL